MPKVTVIACLTISLFIAPSVQAAKWQLDIAAIKKAPIRYAEQSTIREFPVPVVSWRRGGLASGEAEIEEIKAKIIYPTINESRRAIVAFVVEFGQPDNRSIGLQVIWADGDIREAIITRNEMSHYDSNAYKILFAKPVP
jgi:hypothetical protein